MAFKIPVRCGETTTTTGTGTVTTAGAPLQMQTFNAGVGTGNTCPYMIVSGDNVNWERGLGTVTVAAGVTTVARTTVVESSNSNSAISLVGTSFIFVALPGDVAGVNGLLDLVFGSTQGTILYRDSSAWAALAAGTSGYFLKAQGAAANPVWATVSSGSGLFGQVLSATPTAANTGLSTWQTQNGATVSDGTTGIIITGGSASNSNWNMRTKAAPATPYTITALITGWYSGNNVVSTGTLAFAIGFTDGTKLHTVQIQNSNLLVAKYTNSTTFSANDYANGNFYLYEFLDPRWLRIKDDGTNITFYFSADGANFQQLFTTTRASGFLGSSGYTNVFFGVNSNGAIGMGTLLSWTQA